jgi:microsomal dipeptidase-like Zn-dependent dipeptidase
VIADLHAHYAMHLVPGYPAATLDQIVSTGARDRLVDRVRARLVRLASRFANYETFFSGPRVTVPLMREGGVGVALSVLYSPFDEMDLTKRYGAPPGGSYFDTVLRQLHAVEADIQSGFSEQAVVARNPGELDAALAGGKLAFVHCVEGGFHLGGTVEAVDENVRKLAERGVAYVTLAHLFWRSVAANAPALPFLPDPLYRLLFPSPPVGLSELGRTAVAAMVRERVLIDVAHMNGDALEETFALLDELDPAGEVPVVASHVGYRFGRQQYNLSEDTVRRIATRGGVIGLIFAEHQAADGLRRKRTRTFEESFEVLCRHIDRLREITGSHAHTGIGSDLDGFIKPTLAELGDMRRMRQVGQALVARYGEVDGAAIASGNVVRVLRAYWRS